MVQNKELQRQIESYNLRDRLKDLAERELKRQPFRHLPKQFSKGILIGNIAIVPRKIDESRFVYVIADMVNAKILYDAINLKQTAILVAHHLADGLFLPRHILEIDTHFASKIFEITNFRRFIRSARLNKNEAQEFIYTEKLNQANRLADRLKRQIQSNFDATFRMNFAK
jgi:hypothetical protein